MPTNKVSKGPADTAAIAKFSSDLEQAANSISAGQYARWSLQELTQLIDFSKGLWGLASFDGDRVPFSGYKLNADIITQEYVPVTDQDPLMPRLFQDPGTPVCMDVSELQSDDTAEFVAYLNRWSLQRVLSIGYITDVTGVRQLMALYRGIEEPPFSQQDIDMLAIVAPLMFHGLRRARVQELVNTVFDTWSERNAVANVTQTGSIFDIEERFLLGVQKAWPDWQSPTLPDELISLIRNKNPNARLRKQDLLFRKLEASMNRLLVMTELGALGNLTKRQFQIAELYSTGLSTKTIAAQLSIQPVTIENHRKQIYSKLRISTNNELTRLFFSVNRSF